MRCPLHNSGDLEGVPYDPTFAFDPSRVDSTRLEEVVLGPGDMFYVPRGFLHGTRADEDSLSFNISLGAQPWADVLLESLRAYLIRDARLREGAVRALVAARARVDLFKQLATCLSGDDLLGAPEAVASASRAPKRIARRNPLSWWSCASPSGEPCVTVEVRTPDRSATVLEVSREFLSLMAALPEGPEVFAPDELISRWGHDSEAGQEFVKELVKAGLLGWADATHG